MVERLPNLLSSHSPMLTEIRNKISRLVPGSFDNLETVSTLIILSFGLVKLKILSSRDGILFCSFANNNLLSLLIDCCPFLLFLQKFLILMVNTCLQ